MVLWVAVRGERRFLWPILVNWFETVGFENKKPITSMQQDFKITKFIISVRKLQVSRYNSSYTDVDMYVSVPTSKTFMKSSSPWFSIKCRHVVGDSSVRFQSALSVNLRVVSTTFWFVFCFTIWRSCWRGRGGIKQLILLSYSFQISDFNGTNGNRHISLNPLLS